MRKTFIIIDIIVLIGCVVWFMIEKSPEPFVAILTAISGLLSLIYTNPEENANSNPKVILKQKGGKKSKYYQSNGQMTINNDRKKSS